MKFQKRSLTIAILISFLGMSVALGSPLIKNLMSVVAPVVSNSGSHTSQVTAGTIVYDSQSNSFKGRSVAPAGQPGDWLTLGIPDGFYAVSDGEQNLGNLTWDGSSPSGTIYKKYRWVKVGNRVDFWVVIRASVSGAGNGLVHFAFPDDAPRPHLWSGTNPNDSIYFGSGKVTEQSGYSPFTGSATGSEIYVDSSGQDLRAAIYSRKDGGVSASFAEGHITYYTED